MRVLHLTSGRLFGGIEQMLLTIARHAGATPEIEPAFAVAAPGRLADELRASHAPVVDLGDVRLSRPQSVIHGRVRLGRALDEHRPSAIVYHAPWAYALFAGTGHRRGVRVALWQHDHAAGTSVVERWARRTRADLVICNSRWTAGSAVNLQPGVPVAVVHPPVAVTALPPDTRYAVRRALAAADDEVVVLCASRMEAWKGHRHVLRALATIRELPWTMWLAGGAQRRHEAAYVETLAADASRLGIQGRVRLLGERRDVPALMRAADLLCQMNDRPEPFGIVFAEALMSGLPVIAAPLGGAAEIVSDECGRLVAPGDAPGLARALRMLIEDAGLRRRLGAAGPAHAAARCAPATVLPQLAEVLRTMTASAAA